MKTKVSKTYCKVLSDGGMCEIVFSIIAEGAKENVEEILHEFAESSRNAYICLGNKIAYGTEDQEKLKLLAAKEQPAMD